MTLEDFEFTVIDPDRPLVRVRAAWNNNTGEGRNAIEALERLIVDHRDAISDIEAVITELKTS